VVVAEASYQQLLLHDVLHDQPVKRFMRRDPVTVSPSVTVRQWIEDYVYQHHFKMFPVVDNSDLVGCISIDNIKKVPRGDWDTRTVGQVMEPCTSKNTISTDTDTEKLLAAIMRPGMPARYMVVDDGNLVGMISLKDLMELIALKLEIEPQK
jgi:predicted transcriptional regulator